MRGVSRILPLAALVLPAAGVRSPAQAVVGQPMNVSWQLRNNTAVLQSVEISAQPSSEYLTLT